MRGRRVQLVAAFVFGALVASGPQIAIAAFDAVNADKVDGRHAVGAGTAVADRVGKLVATNSAGRLPSNIIAKAPNAELLDGLDSAEYQRRVSGVCPEGQLATAVNADGSLACTTDTVDGGNAQTLDGIDGVDYQRRLVGTCAPSQKMLTAGANGSLSCSSDLIDGGNAQTLDGIDSTGLQRAYRRTLIVSPGGTATQNGQALLAAVTTILQTPGTRSANNRWLIKLEPGTYQVTPNSMALRDWIDIEGSGPGTIITCACGAASFNPEAATMNVNANTVGDIELRSLTIANTVGSSYGLGLYAQGSTGLITLRDVHVNVSGSSSNVYGLVVGRRLRMERGSVAVAGSANTFGIEMTGNLTAIGVEVDAAAAITATGVRLLSGLAGEDVIRDSTVRAAVSPSSSTATAITAGSNAAVFVDDSWVRATSGQTRRAIETFGTTVVNVAGSRLEGTVTGPGTEVCVASYTTTYTALNASCL